MEKSRAGNFAIRGLLEESEAKMLKSWIFWLIVVAVLVVLFVIGCDPYGGPEVRVASSIAVYNENTSLPDSIHPEGNGRPGTADVGFLAGYRYETGDAINVGGLVMDYVTRAENTGYYNTGGWWIDLPENDESFPFSLPQGRIVTGRDGLAHFKISSYYDARMVYGGAWAGFMLSGRRNGSQPAYARFRSQIDRRAYPLHVPMMEKTITASEQYVGAYWRSGSAAPDGDRQTGVGSLSKPASLRLSSDEQAFLDSSEPVESEGIQVVSVLWYRDNGDSVEEATFIVPAQISEPNNIEQYATPYVASFLLKSEDSIDFYASLSGKLLSDAEPNGIDIEITIVRSSADCKRHVARSTYFVPVDQACYVPDPNGYTVMGKNAVLIPVTETDRIRIQPTPESRDFLQFTDEWLSDNKNLDKNRDGIVNFSDWMYGI